MTKQLRFKLVGALAAVIAPLSFAHAGGFEKPIYEGAKMAGYAGIGAPTVQGADGLLFNPASLVNTKTGSQLSLNLSPTWSKLSAPIDINNDTANSSTSLNMPFSFIYDLTLNDSWAVAIGGYTVGGGHTYYDAVSMGGSNAPSDTSADFAMNELSVGASYKINEAWAVGLSYRLMSTMASFKQAGVDTQSGIVSDIGVGAANGWDANGFRVGATYKPTAKTNVALVYRSEMALHASGNYIGSINNGATSLGVAQTGATIHTTLPQQIVLGAEQDYDTWKTMLQLEWTNYGRVDRITMDGQTSYAGGTITPGALNEFWQDQYAARIGAEYAGWDWPVRFGYAYTSAAALSSWAQAALTPPGSTHTLTLGTGHGWVLGNETLDFNAALEYDYASGNGDGYSAGNAPNSALPYNTTRSGTYTLNDYTVHLGLAWAF